MDLNFAIYSFTALLIIVNPLATVPLFISFLEGVNPDVRNNMIRRAVVIAAVVLIIFTVTGSYIFSFLGIEMYSFRIAGGILIFIISLEMLFGRRTQTESVKEEEIRVEDIVITPLAVPLLTGPGAITTGIVLFNSAKTRTEELILLIDIILVFLVSYFILSKSKKIFEIFGSTGTKVIVRVMGLLLAAIAVQFIITGVGEAIGAIK